MHDFVEKELLLLKKEYEKPQMSQAQFEENGGGKDGR